MTYTLRADDSLRPLYCWPKRARFDLSIEDEVATERFEEYWLHHSAAHASALQNGDVDEAWRILVAGLETTWKRQGEEAGAFDGRALAPTRRANACTRHQPGSLRIRRITCLLGLVVEHRRRPNDDLERKISRNAYGAHNLRPDAPHWLLGV